MKRKCFLHLGLHKTASSSAQATFRASRKALRKHNIEYPIFKCYQADKKIKRVANHSIPIFSLYSGDPHSYHVNIRWKLDDIAYANSHYLNQLETLSTLGRDILLSGEAISVLPISGLQNLSSLLADLGFEVVPFAVVRPPYSYACSAIQQQIKGGRFIKILEECEDSHPTNLTNFTIPTRSSILEILLKHYGSVLRLISFTEATTHPNGPVGYIVENLKICSPKDLSYIRVNDSSGNKWVRAKNLSNKYYRREMQTMAANAQGLRSNTRYTNDNKFLLTKSEFGLVEDQLVQEARRLSDLAGRLFTEETYKFSTPLTTEDWKLIYLETLTSRSNE